MAKEGVYFDNNEILGRPWQGWSKAFTWILRDQQDFPFLVQMALDSLLLVPLGLSLFMFKIGLAWYISAISYFVLLAYSLGPHLLMLHNICHRSPWQNRRNGLLDFLLNFNGIFYGLPPRLYYLHHIKMHHREDNASSDLSSTQSYQRDSFFHWLIYFLRFSLLGWIELPLYFLKNKKWNFALQTFLSYLSFFAILSAAIWINSKAAFVVFIFPTALCWFGLMAGNWAQHAFIDPNDPTNNYKNSITVVASLYNYRCFNDGYHIGHHLNAGRHWTDMPRDFFANKNYYFENKSVVFKKIDYQMIWVHLMFKNYKKLAQYLVDLDEHPQSTEAKINFIRERLNPIGAQKT